MHDSTHQIKREKKKKQEKSYDTVYDNENVFQILRARIKMRREHSHICLVTRS